MGKTIYIQCYEGLSAKMMVEALLNLMPEQTQAKATVDQLLTLDCPAEVKAAMIRKLPRKIKDFALPEGAEELFQRAYDIWLHAKAAVQRVNIAHVEFQEKDYHEVIAMLAASICMERLEADTIICPIVYDGYGQIYIDHEPVSVPLPETLYILMGAEIAMHRMERDSAWVTPEGAAFLAACRTSDHLPEEYHVSKIGTGRGTASDGSNGVLRIMVLEDGNAEKSGMADFSEKEAVEKNIEANFPEKEEIEKNIEADFPEKEAEQEHILQESPVSEEENTESVTKAPEQNSDWDDDLEFLEESIISQVASEKEPDEIQAEEPKQETVAEDIVCTDTTTPNEIWKLECNIDDCGGEVLGYTMERLMENGALDACYLPIYMKKNRPAYMLTVLCRPEDRERLEDIIFEETTTIGIRRALMQRTILQRRKSTEQTSLGDVAVKTMKKKNGEVPTLEYESVAAIAREQHLPFREVYRRLEKELY
ncbi:LarC family nickel insertion protein [Eubacterium ramulus]|uniref:LarC family nickel insertion protein n=1 Tax=Eubacterium ramulus TaxID=39490 RepID=UPI003520BC93